MVSLPYPPSTIGKVAGAKPFSVNKQSRLRAAPKPNSLKHHHGERRDEQDDGRDATTIPTEFVAAFEIVVLGSFKAR